MSFSEIMAYAIGIGMPITVVVFATIACIVGAVLVSSRPYIVLAGFCLVFFFFSGSSWGTLEATGRSIYGRGTGLVYFPLLLWGLLGGWLCIKVGQVFSGDRTVRQTPTILYWFAGWTALLFCHVLWAMTTGIELKDALSATGFSNIPWMGILIMVMIASGTSETVVDRLSKSIVILAFGRSLFGLGRWVAFGGDPANAYQNYGGVNVKITFFDINDGLLCALGLTISALYLLGEKQSERIGNMWKALYAFAALTCTLSIVLSYRRSEWGGLMLVALYIFLLLPRDYRLPVAVLGLPALFTGIVFVAIKRLGQTRGVSGGPLAFVYDLLPKSYGADDDRVLELRYTLETILNNPVAGVGAWGSYDGASRIAWQGNEAGGSFVHSGLLHIALKSGMIGIALLTGVVVAFVVHVRSLPHDLSVPCKVLVAAGVAGLIFMIPDFLIGTPIPQVRTTQMIAFCAGLPYLVSAALTHKGVRA
ncbi:O-antigen ligase family protein [Accumulibacter sp.]|uniref:O-antigen ligase family protein n=1 Tax=Accumulibacter sp. TaxID=2053492 RepID=UPI0025D61868|nr:O-antigen ligase family protein [Accumulibacter sp.]MCM8611622.1 O-antigen ligase family protein [Accumulibacter sp.]MCM8635387.1 O-antigen ligase family protein [Accumulibacter sp.]MCM8638992.1 O-antigen ligase family protein [Accumulibacter sp.]